MANENTGIKREREDHPEDKPSQISKKYDYVSRWKTVKVIVGRGAKKETFTIHMATLCRSSIYFKKRCADSKDDSVEFKLPETSVKAFEACAERLYAGKFDLADRLSKNDQDHPEVTNMLRRLLDCWMTGVQVQDCTFRNEAMDGMVKLLYGSREKPDPMAIAEMVETECLLGSRVGGLAVDFVAQYVTADDLEDGPTE